VDALFKSGDKNSVTNKTLSDMTPEQQTAIVGSVEKILMKQAKKGLRVEAMKVLLCIHTQ
jgi:hypothetical protein